MRAAAGLKLLSITIAIQATAACTGAVPAPTHLAQKQNIVIVLGKMVEEGQVYGGQEGVVSLVGSVEYAIKVSRVFYGTLGSVKSFKTRVETQYSLKLPLSAFFVLEREPDGSLFTLAWNQSRNGFCADEQAAMDYGISSIIKTLKETYPCRIH